jgi:hypothetical protein
MAMYPYDPKAPSRAATLAKVGAALADMEGIIKGLSTFAEEERWPESLRETLKHLNNIAVDEQERIRVTLGGAP